jgi:fucose 4-O-acetylase-like acetyltransferase
MTQRLEWVDIFKAVAIIAIVIGHSGSPTPIFNLMYAFHLPAFFFISGYVFNPQKAFFLVVKDRFKRLLVPYLSFALLFIGLHAILRILNSDTFFYDSTPVEITSPLFILKSVITTSYINPLAGITWFLWVLFETTLFSALLIKVLQRYHISYLLLCLPMIGLFLFGVLVIYPRYPVTSWPYYLDINFATIPYFLLGFLAQYYEVFRKKCLLLWLSPLMMIIFYIFAWKHNAAVGFIFREFNYWYYFIPASLAAFVCLFSFSTFVEMVGWLKQVFTFIGKRTLSIMCLHLFAFKIVFIFLSWLGVSPTKIIACSLIPQTAYFWGILTVLSISVSLILSKLIEKNRYFSFFFLGISESKKELS